MHRKKTFLLCSRCEKFSPSYFDSISFIYFCSHTSERFISHIILLVNLMVKVSVLEDLTSEILEVSAKYVRLSNKYTIKKNDVSLVIAANLIYNEIFNSNTVNGLPKLNTDEVYDTYDDDETMNDSFISQVKTQGPDELVFGNLPKISNY